ncbi:MAG: hypothetical protein OEX11_00760 [Nitrosomonas sp.]|nr:hypothetical protein [Nitrosomonas sp.]
MFNKLIPQNKTTRVISGFGLLAFLLWIISDITITTATPGAEFKLMLAGLLHPQWPPLTELAHAILQTISYALLGVTLAATGGFLLSLIFHLKIVRVACASLRAVHELFWGLLLIQLFGLQPLTGLLAIAIPYTGILAKIYAEIRQEAHHRHKPHLPHNCSVFSRFLYADWPLIKTDFTNYTLYRFECGLRSGTILGFIGLPTLGFQLESAFMQGHYADVTGLLFIFYGLIATIHWWGQFKFWPIYLSAAVYYLWPDISFSSSDLNWLLEQITPTPWREINNNFGNWFYPIISEQLLPGLWNTLVTGQIALVLSAGLALILYPLLSNHFGNSTTRLMGNLSLVIMRSTPELILGFALLILWGPSLLPAIIALAIHNGAIIGHLTGHHSNNIPLRPDAPKGINRYSYEITPRVFNQFLIFTFYRWEVIMRESALLGILGLHTLGFFIDSAFESFRLDVALILIIASAALNIGVDSAGRVLRQYLHLPKYRVIG